jgi:hypothetical protein
MSGELMVEEYKWLRRELLQLSASVLRWQLVGFVSAGIAIAVALVTGVWLIAAAALVVIAGCVFGIIHDLTSMQRIAAYIQVFHEGQDTGALWEMRTENTPEVYQTLPRRDYMTPLTSLMLAGMVCAIVVGLLPVFFLIQSFEGPNYWLISIPLAWIALWILVIPSFRALSRNRFKAQARRAFYDSLKRPPKEESGPL